MIAALTAFLATLGGKALIASLLVPLLGLLSQTAAYKAARRVWGRVCYRAGSVVSIFGKTKLGAVWQPAENLILDFLAFGVEQAAAGLRSDNVDKLEDHIERLADVGSVTRAKAIAEKLETLGRTPQPLQTVQDAAIANRAIELGNESLNRKLGE